jgi:LPS sulfotransferase NodH
VFRPPRSYLLVGWPRTGSTVLADALTATGVLGQVHEYFWRLVEPTHAAAVGLAAPTDATYAPYLDAALRQGTTDNGVFGAKFFWAHAIDLVRRTALIPDFADLEPIERLWAPFGSDVRAVLIRRNCLRSALSLWRAEVTEEWGRLLGATPAHAPAKVDLWQLSELHADIHAAEIGWRAVLEASRRPRLEITYEDIASDLVGVVDAIAEFAEVELPAGVDLVHSYVQQADDSTDAFEDAWNAATGGCDACKANPLQL